MSIQYLRAAFELAITGPKKPVLISLADRVNNAGYCYPSMRDIAFRAGFSERTVMRSVSELEALGLLAVIRNLGESNKYILLLNNLSTSNDTESRENDIHSHDRESLTSDRDDKKQCQSVTLIPKNPQESLRARESEFSKGESQANSRAYKIYHPEKTRQAGKATAGKEMKHIKALLSGSHHDAK